MERDTEIELMILDILQRHVEAHDLRGVAMTVHRDHYWIRRESGKVYRNGPSIREDPRPDIQQRVVTETIRNVKAAAERLRSDGIDWKRVADKAKPPDEGFVRRAGALVSQWLTWIINQLEVSQRHARESARVMAVIDAKIAEIDDTRSVCMRCGAKQ